MESGLKGWNARVVFCAKPFDPSLKWEDCKTIKRLVGSSYVVLARVILGW